MGNALAYETRVGSPPDFQPKRVSAPSCFLALNRSAQAGRRANVSIKSRDWSSKPTKTLKTREHYPTNLPCLRLFIDEGRPRLR